MSATLESRERSLARTISQIVCRCGSRYEPPARKHSHQVRMLARGDGWHQPRGTRHWLCPDCAPALAIEEEDELAR